MKLPQNMSRGDALLDQQVSFWNRWNAETREHALQDVSLRQAEIITQWFDRLNLQNPRILEVGCGTGWFTPQLDRYGRVTATDLSDEVLGRAAERWPEVEFRAGDFMTLDFGNAVFDVIVTLEVLAHVADQKAFVRKMASHLRPGGWLMLATQNREVLERYNRIPPPGPGQLRRWVYRHELLGLLQPEFLCAELFTVCPKANIGVMRWVNSAKLNRPVRAVAGNALERLKERLGYGWTLMSLSKKTLSQAFKVIVSFANVVINSVI